MWWSETRGKVWLQRALLGGSLLWLAACGFQFRTAPDFPADMAVTYIQTDDRYSLFYRELVSTLRRRDIKLTADPAEAQTVIRILGDETGRRTLTVTARNVPAEYEVWYRVTFSVDVNGKEAVPYEELFLTRDYPFDETQVLGKANEEQLIMQAIARDMVGLVSRRLAAID
jgi:LPS-assembly lipoprotein